MDSLPNTQQSGTVSRALGESHYHLNQKSIASLAQIDNYNQNTNNNSSRFQEHNYYSQSRFNPYTVGSVTSAHDMYNPYNSGLYSHPGSVMPVYAAYDGKCFFLNIVFYYSPKISNF